MPWPFSPTACRSARGAPVGARARERLLMRLLLLLELATQLDELQHEKEHLADEVERDHRVIEELRRKENAHAAAVEKREHPDRTVRLLAVQALGSMGEAGGGPPAA